MNQSSSNLAVALLLSLAVVQGQADRVCNSRDVAEINKEKAATSQDAKLSREASAHKHTRRWDGQPRFDNLEDHARTQGSLGLLKHK